MEAKAILGLKNALNKNFIRAVCKLFDCKGRVVIIGLGKSGLIARKIASTMSSVGTPSIFLHPVECLHGDLGVLTPSDIVIALSHSGQTREINNLIPVLKNMGIYVIAMTGVKKSRLAKLSDLLLHTPVKYQACPFSIAPTTSTTVMLAAGDALAISLMKLKNFDESDLARLHPAGTIGRMLTLKVKDLMIKGVDNPVIGREKSVKEALIVMTKTRMGAVSVVDKRGRLCGFFTDGDIRRNLQKNPNVLNLELSAVMTKNPITVAPDIMAIDAARLIKSKKIDNLPVVNGIGRPIGILDEKNLLDAFPLTDE
jgi:arabinose-5-phosphate isomerase